MSHFQHKNPAFYSKGFKVPKKKTGNAAGVHSMTKSSRTPFKCEPVLKGGSTQ